MFFFLRLRIKVVFLFTFCFVLKISTLLFVSNRGNLSSLRVTAYKKRVFLTLTVLTSGFRKTKEKLYLYIDDFHLYFKN